MGRNSRRSGNEKSRVARNSRGQIPLAAPPTLRDQHALTLNDAARGTMRDTVLCAGKFSGASLQWGGAQSEGIVEL
jgi:hypothetical protein